jgi:DNA invertase Pin-like site-specific DNA recombinase
MSNPLRPAKLKPWHLDRAAVVYVRQSTPQQVHDHQESTARQYALAGRAADLGWARDRVLVIDDDLGKSGQSAEGRPGFQRLLAEIALDRVGLVLGLEVSRLARSCKDWHQLLEVCARFRVLLADADGLYDPTDYNDRLLLGLKGTMSEAELHILKERLYQGKLNKVRRGELLGRPPVGYVRLATGEWALDPDEQVRATIRLVFDQLDRQPSLHAVLRYLTRHGIRVPVRPHCGPSPGQLEWRRANRTTLLNLVRHPAYAGAFRFGYRRTDPRRKQPGRPHSGRRLTPLEECAVVLRDRVPAYITWDRFLANQQRLTANRSRADTPGAPRNGAALLGGLVRCGRCGGRMQVQYNGPKGRPYYSCMWRSTSYAEPVCQTLSGTVLDRFVAGQILAAVEPAALEASLAAVAGVERERAALAKQWQLRRERARYEADRAARQYHACEPENRLVARELERRWEQALTLVRQLDDEFERWEHAAPARLSAEDERSIRSLAADLPAVWHAATTTPADRKRVARLLLERVVVTVDKASERVAVELHWLGSAVRSHVVTRPVDRYERRSDFPQLVERLRALCAEGLTARAVAERLNAEGFRPPRRATQFNISIIWWLMARVGLPRRPRYGATTGLGANEFRPIGLARRLKMSKERLRRWLRSGWLSTRRDEYGHRIIWADGAELGRLRALGRLLDEKAPAERLAQLKVPKRRPKR